MDDGVYLDDDELPLKMITEQERQWYDPDNSTDKPEAFYLTEDQKIGFLAISNDSYTAKVWYWTPVTEMTDVATDTLPYYGIWNNFIQELLVLHLKHGQDRDISIDSLVGSDYYDRAMRLTLMRGVKERRINSGFFNLEGV
jgi:hypothetical protein